LLKCCKSTYMGRQVYDMCVSSITPYTLNKPQHVLNSFMIVSIFLSIGHAISFKKAMLIFWMTSWSTIDIIEHLIVNNSIHNNKLSPWTNLNFYKICHFVFCVLLVNVMLQLVTKVKLYVFDTLKFWIHLSL